MRINTVRARFHFIAASCLLAACATTPSTDGKMRITPEEAAARFQAAKCCLSLAQIAPSPLEAERWLPSTDGQPLLASPAGKGFYAAFVLPDDDKTYHFRVESFVSRAGDTAAQVVVPLVLILNADFSISRASSQSMLSYLPENRFYSERESLYLFARVDRKLKPSEKYIVVTTFERLLGQELTFTAISGGDIMVIPLGKTVATSQSPIAQRGVALRSLPIGEVRLRYLASKWDQPAYERSIKF